MKIEKELRELKQENREQRHNLRMYMAMSAYLWAREQQNPKFIEAAKRRLELFEQGQCECCSAPLQTALNGDVSCAGDCETEGRER